MEEEIKTNIFLESQEKKPAENSIPNENEEEEETYNTLEEYFLDICRDGDMTEFKDCLENQVDIFCCDKNLNTPLHMLCANGHKVLLEILMKTISEKNPKDKSKLINQQNCDGNTALHWAVVNGKIEIVAILLENQCDCSIKNAFGKTPLDEALNQGFENIAEVIAPHTKMTLEEFEAEGEQNCEIKEENSDEEVELSQINKQ